MYQDIHYGRHLVHNPTPDPTSKIVGFPQGKFRIGLDVENHPMPSTYPTCQNLLSRPHTVDPVGNVSHFLQKRLIRGPIHEVLDRGTKEADPVEKDDGRGEESGRIIGKFPSWAAHEGHTDAHKGGEGGYRVGAVVPGVGSDCEAVHFLSNGEDLPKESLLYSHHENEDRQRKWGRSMMGGDDLPDSLDGDSQPSSEKEKRDDGC